MPVSVDDHERLRERVELLSQNSAVALAAATALEKRVEAIEAVLSKLTWMVVTAVIGALLAMVVYNGGIPGVTR